MRLRMITTMCDERGCMPAGSVANVDADEAEELIAGGYAILLDSRPQPEEAIAPAAPERAVLSRKVKR